MQVLEATEALLQHFPDDSNLILSKASSLSMLQSRGVQLAWLEQHCQARWSDPLIVVRYANLLGDGGGQGATVQYLLNQALRQAPGQAPAWNALASLRWGEGMREQSCELYRFAACLHAANEGYSNQYFRALRCLGRTEEGMHFLRQRHQQLGALAAGPSITLSALKRLGMRMALVMCWNRRFRYVRMILNCCLDWLISMGVVVSLS
jgi:predicted Zn-dependent protease